MEIKITFDSKEERQELLSPILKRFKVTEKKEVTLEEVETIVNELLLYEFLQFSSKGRVRGASGRRFRFRNKKVDIGIVPQDKS